MLVRMSEAESDAEVLTTRAARHDAILGILATQRVTSQEQLRKALAERGFDTVQATLSRDLSDLHATKVRTSDGKAIYAVPDVTGTHAVPSANDSQLARWCEDLLVEAESAQNLVVARTPSGAANLLGAAIDGARMDSVIGSVAGDDTVLVVCRSESEAEDVRRTLLGLAQPSRSGKTD